LVVYHSSSNQMHMGFGQMFKESEIPFHTFSSNDLISHKVSEDTWVAVLKESVRVLFKEGAGAQPISINTMNSTHYSYIEYFMNAVTKDKLNIKLRPDWILYKD